MMAPGSCEDCQADPRKKAWCQRVAALRGTDNDYISPRSRNSSVGIGIEPLRRIDSGTTSDLSRYSIGCSDAFKLFDGRVPTDPDKMDWVSNLKPLSPHSTGRDTLPTLEPHKKYSALELDTAGVIATLQSSMQPIALRPTDAPHEEIVRIALERQHFGTSL
ncbi:hypothetical protein K504DRAFT_459890 [Pleomassaria siparia CBS 279.74]|uniref:Uncharacterized protein n=1 Tax=Pleomassaria siparia CBS 279.74 TaxID=1314801 RepID=A0A6G1K005_9PLEO|nr:hypothetical protein K504DRAFT_459890 [Pleomassaria siparia CBS 279.74]